MKACTAPKRRTVEGEVIAPVEGATLELTIVRAMDYNGCGPEGVFAVEAQIGFAIYFGELEIERGHREEIGNNNGGSRIKVTGREAGARLGA